MDPAARTAPSTARNRDPILEVLRARLTAPGTVLEVASGAGEHAVHMAAGLPHIVWRPSERDDLSSIAAWRAEVGLPNLMDPVVVDASRPDDWPVEAVDAVVCINMVHISPWAATEGLMRGSGRVLGPGGRLFLYGPYREEGVQTAPSNEAFDTSLKSRDPAWGLRLVADVAAEGARHGLALTERIAMPANNLILVFEKR